MLGFMIGRLPLLALFAASCTPLGTPVPLAAPGTADTADPVPALAMVPTSGTTRSSAKHVISLRGSNTLGVALAPKLVRAFLAHEGATDIEVRTGKTKEQVWIKANLDGPLWIEINTPGTKYGFQSLEQDYCDVVLASRPVSVDEAGKLIAFGDLTAPASENVVAMDGIAVIVQPNNPLDQLSVAQLAMIFSGKVTNWQQVGGPALPIHVFERDSLSGTHDAFVSLVMNGAHIKSEKTFEDSQELARTVQTTDGAIGFVGLPYIQQTKALAIQDGDAAALYPTPFTVATEDYALSRRLFFYTPATPKDPLTGELVEFAMSDEGQAVVSDAGFVPLSLRAEAAKIATGAPAAYGKLASGATRLSVDFRFRLNSFEIDTKALHDLERLTRYLASPVNRGRRLALVGFADAQGADATNLLLSKQRAEAIAGLLKRRGVAPDEVASFGSALPIAPNDSPQGRARNRRVEVWLR